VAITQMQKHLRKYVEDGMQQKMRLNKMTEAYNEQEYKTTERIIDERSLRAKLLNEGIDPLKIDDVTDRIVRDEEILDVIKGTMSQTEEDIKGLTYRMNAHLEELTEIEILSGGFVTHTIGVGENVAIDKENMIVRFQPEGHIEIPIAARMNKWKDSSQLTIKKIIKE
jgi:hypothetical protein